MYSSSTQEAGLTKAPGLPAEAPRRFLKQLSPAAGGVFLPRAFVFPYSHCWGLALCIYFSFLGVTVYSSINLISLSCFKSLQKTSFRALRLGPPSPVALAEGVRTSPRRQAEGSVLRREPLARHRAPGPSDQPTASG